MKMKMVQLYYLVLGCAIYIYQLECVIMVSKQHIEKLHCTLAIKVRQCDHT